MRTHKQNTLSPLLTKYFCERLNHCLDETGAPTIKRERAIVLSKMLNISRQQAWALIEGHLFPDPTMLQTIADEFEVDPIWLAGEK